MVAMPTLDWMYTGTARSLRELEVPPGSQVLLMSNSTAVASKRNELVARFLAARPKLSWLLFLDADMLFPPFTVRRLLKWQKGVVSGVYGYKNAEKGYRVTAEPAQSEAVMAHAMRGLVEVKWVGAGCLMIQRRVVEDLVTHPWFEANPEDIGEDIAFCEKVRAAGEKVWLDAEFVVGHIGQFSYTPNLGYAAEIIRAMNDARARGQPQVVINV